MSESPRFTRDGQAHDREGLISREQLQRERQRARELRQSAWWRRKLARGVCHYCRRKFPPGELTMDHLVPLVRGGRSTKSNCVACCKECNTNKSTLLPLEWGEYLRGFQEEGGGP